MKKGDSVLVTTKYMGVYHGTLKKADWVNQYVVLTQANMAIEWATTNGVDELAERGPNKRSIVGALAREIYLPGVTSIVLCTGEAKKQWMSHKD